MEQFVYDNILTIIIFLCGCIGVAFTVFYQYKRAGERSLKNESEITELKNSDFSMKEIVVELQRSNALIAQQIKNHEKICDEHKDKLDRHLERIYNKLNGDKD